MEKTLGPLTYWLKLPERWKIHPVFHTCLLSPYRETREHGPGFSEPPPETVEGEEEFEVEAITGHQKRGKGYQYLVKWKGYPMADNSWEPEFALKNAFQVLSAYKKRHRL